jgi:hypothetical protein
MMNIIVKIVTIVLEPPAPGKLIVSLLATELISLQDF